VIEKYFINENNSDKASNRPKLYSDGVNVITNSSGRGNNWALGYSLDYKESGYLMREEKNINIDSFEKINKFIEKCQFLKGFLFIHSLNGGTGSGVTTRLIESLKDEFPKFTFIDCPVIGLNSNFILELYLVENTTLSQFNKFFTYCHLYEHVDYFFLISVSIIYMNYQ
jgi:hypothetical protein